MALPLKELKAFIYLAEELHFQRASELAHLTPSALTRMVQRMEARIGSPLLYRSKPQLSLTPAGSSFYRYAKQSLDDWQQLLTTINEHHDVLKGRVSLYCSVTAAYSVVRELLPLFRQAHPQIDIDLYTGDSALALERLSAQREQLVVCAEPRSSQHYLYKELRRAQLQLIVPRMSCAVRQAWLTQPNDFAQLPWIISQSGIVRERFKHWAKQHAKGADIYAQVAGHEAIVSMVSLGFGVAWVPDLVLEHSPQKNAIEVLAKPPAIDDFSIGLCMLEASLNNPLLKALWHLV